MNRSTAARLLRVATGELQRSIGRMRIAGHPRPFYLGYLIRDEESWRIQARYGSISHSAHERRRNAFCDVRVGSYRSDQVREGGLLDNDKEAESYGHVDLPFGNSDDGLRHALWRLTDARYREAVEQLLDKRSHALHFRDPTRGLPAFERREPVVDNAWQKFPEVDGERWADFVERAAGRLKRYPEIRESHVEFEAEHICRVFTDSEGTQRVGCQAIWSLECYLWLLAPDGNAFPWTLKHVVTDPAELPDSRAFAVDVRSAVANLRRLAGASTIRSFCGPALLEPGPAGLLMHEAVGHRLEGDRLLSLGEGQTFKDSLGQQILPEFLSLRDDPTITNFEGRTLVGHYRFDDEGVGASATDLVRDGRLVGFLTSRTGISRGHRSNGHARSRYHQRPISRMGTLIVEARAGLSDDELKGVLLEEIRRSGAPFGVRIIEALSGETATDAYNFQAFLGEINFAAKVFPDGREEWIRGVDFIGTPLNGIHGIVAAGRRYHVDNAWCGAESGYVPVSTISPALVLSELELQSKPESPYTAFSLPGPWED